MAAGLENVYENEITRQLRPAFGHASIEINAQCPFATPRGCSDTCVLIARRAPTTHLLKPQEIREAFGEILDCGPRLRHTGAPGMEPLATPDILFDLLAMYHERPPASRPLTFNVITSGVNLARLGSRFQEYPVDALVVSVDDAPSTGLRVVGAGDTALRAGLRLREIGGCKRLCVNTILTGENAEVVLSIAARLRAAGVDQLLVSPLRLSSGLELVPAVTQRAMLSWAYAAARSPQCVGLSILVEVEPETIWMVNGNSDHTEMTRDWSVRVRLEGSNVALMGVNSAAPFVRVRWDGQLMNRSDLFKVNVPSTPGGRYVPGRIRELLDMAASPQEMESCLV